MIALRSTLNMPDRRTLTHQGMLAAIKARQDVKTDLVNPICISTGCGFSSAPVRPQGPEIADEQEAEENPQPVANQKGPVVQRFVLIRLRPQMLRKSIRCSRLDV